MCVRAFVVLGLFAAHATHIAAAPKTPPPRATTAPAKPKKPAVRPAPAPIKTAAPAPPTAPPPVTATATASAAPPPPVHRPARAPAPSTASTSGAPRVAIAFAPKSASDAWLASGLEDVVADELVRFRSVTRLENDASIRERCAPGDGACLVGAFRAAGADAIVLGALDGTRLTYDVYDGGSGVRAFGATFDAADREGAALGRHVSEIVRPIVQRDGLLDRKATPPPRRAAPETRTTPRDGRRSGLALVALLAIVALAAPALFLFASLGRRALAGGAPRSWRWSARLAFVLGLAGLAAAVVDVPAAVWGSPLAPLVAGVTWGTFAVVTASFAFARVGGVEHIRSDALWPFLRAWIALALLRLVGLALLVAPALALVAWGARTDGVDDHVTIALLAPLAGLFAYFWLFVLVDNLARRLDHALVVGPASEQNAWHPTVKRYARGYVRRIGIRVDDARFERVLFLPTRRRGVTSYGGGFGAPRILVGDDVREGALGELPDEEPAPDTTVNGEELPLGLVLPSPAEHDARALALSDARRRAASEGGQRPRGFVPRRIGENATLLGWILPQPRAEGLPLIADTEDDYAVVKRLLTEHYAAYDAGLDDDEVDDTDPRQKDFLFGALLREIGAAARRDTVFSTLRLACEALVSRIVATVWERSLAGPSDKIADAYVALNGGFHHLVQYLGFVGGVAPDTMTARANAPKLALTSHETIRSLSSTRVLWLARFFHAPLGSAANLRFVRWASALALIALLSSFFARSISEAKAYHPTWLARMRAYATSNEGDSTR